MGRGIYLGEISTSPRYGHRCKYRDSEHVAISKTGGSNWLFFKCVCVTC